MAKWINIGYKCTCMKDEAPLLIIERGRHEDLMDFMDRVANVIGPDHLKRSPLCQQTKMEYLKIPDNPEGVGYAKGGTA